MPKADPVSSTKASSPPPTSPRRVSLPMTPAAVSRNNPIDASVSPKGSPSADRNGRDAKTSELAERVSPRASSEAPVPKPPTGPSQSASIAAALAVRPAAAPVPAAPKAKPSEPPIDMDIFEQILELDDDDDAREFSRGVVQGYFDQFQTTYEDIGSSLKNGDYTKLSSLGHFLKGSSAALGVRKVQETCEGIQYAGALRGDQDTPLTKEQALKRIQELYDRVEGEFNEAKDWFENYFPGGVGESTSA